MVDIVMTERLCAALALPQSAVALLHLSAYKLHSQSIQAQSNDCLKTMLRPKLINGCNFGIGLLCVSCIYFNHLVFLFFIVGKGL